MKLFSEGTKSYLFGCHQFFIHPMCVLVGWLKVHGRFPAFWELCCIFLHDIGHWGKNYLTHYPEKREHWRLGAEIALRLFGLKGYLLIAGHTKSSGFPRSDLFLPDKVSWLVAPKWWLYSNRIVEPQLKVATIDQFQSMVRENIRTGCTKGNHDIYLQYSGQASQQYTEERREGDLIQWNRTGTLSKMITAGTEERRRRFLATM